MGMTQNAISRLESSSYGKSTITTLKRLASAYDVALVVRFVPFSQLVDWVSGTERVDYGMSSSSFDIAPYGKDFGLNGAVSRKVALEDALVAALGSPESLPSGHDRIAPGVPNLRIVPSGTGISSDAAA